MVISAAALGRFGGTPEETEWTAEAAYDPAAFPETATEEARLLLREMRKGSSLDMLNPS